MYDMPDDVKEFLYDQERKAADERYQREREEVERLRADRKAAEEAKENEKQTDWAVLSDAEYRDACYKRFGANF